MRSLRVGIWRYRGHTTHAADFQALIPFLFLLRPAIEFENDAFFPDIHVGNLRSLSRTGSRAVLRDQGPQFSVARLEGAVSERESSFAHGKNALHKNELGIQTADHRIACVLSHGRGDWRGRGLSFI